MNAPICGECPYKPHPIGLAVDPEVIANKSFVVELGLLCPNDDSLVVRPGQHACGNVTRTYEKEKRSKK